MPHGLLSQNRDMTYLNYLGMRHQLLLLWCCQCLAASVSIMQNANWQTDTMLNGWRNKQVKLWVFCEMEAVATDASRLTAMALAMDSCRHLPK